MPGERRERPRERLAARTADARQVDGARGVGEHDDLRADEAALLDDRDRAQHREQQAEDGERARETDDARRDAAAARGQELDDEEREGERPERDGDADRDAGEVTREREAPGHAPSARRRRIRNGAWTWSSL